MVKKTAKKSSRSDGAQIKSEKPDKLAGSDIEKDDIFESTPQRDEARIPESAEKTDSGQARMTGDTEPKEVQTHPTGLFNIFISSKTFIITHLLLLIIGLGIFLGLAYYLNGSFLICCSESEFAKYIPVTKKPSSLSLNLANPDDERLVFDQSLIVSGNTSENTTVIIANVTTNQTIGVETNQKGDFSKVINLEEGVNELVIVAFDLQGNSKSENRTIYYSEEKL